MTQSIMLHEISPDGLRALIAEEVNKLQYNPDKFENVIVPGEWFCKIHSISRITLQRWIDQGVVIPEDDSKHHKFSLAYILKFDVASIKRKRNKQLIIINNEQKKKNVQRYV